MSCLPLPSLSRPFPSSFHAFLLSPSSKLFKPKDDPCPTFPHPFHPSIFPSLLPSLQVRAIVLENMGDDAKVQDYLKANGDDKAEFAAMGFDSLDLVEFSMAIQKVR